jgi:phage portal protein BeeE
MLGSLVRSRKPEERAGQLSFPDYLHLFESFGFQGINYVVPSGGIGELTALQAQRNPIVWACISVRLMVFSEIRFQFQGWKSGRPGDRFGTKDLSILEEPWPQATTGDLLARMETDVSLYGNSYWVHPQGSPGLVRLNPTRVTIATTDAIDAETGNTYGKKLAGYFLNDSKGQVAATFLPDEICHYKPIPDPSDQFRGATWLNALLPDVIADMDLTDYKHAFLKNAATPNLVVNFKDKVSPEAFDAFRDRMESSHTGPQSGFKTLYLGSGADVKVVGSNFADLAMAAVQSAGEVRIAAAARVPAGILGLGESLKGSTLNSGNYTAIRRSFSDTTMRPLWRSASGALSTLLTIPTMSRLWYDDRDVSFLQEDVKDAADIRQIDAAAIHELIGSGFFPTSVIEAVTTGDYSKLRHTGLISTLLQKPGPAVPAGGTQQDDPTLPDDPEPPPT